MPSAPRFRSGTAAPKTGTPYQNLSARGAIYGRPQTGNPGHIHPRSTLVPEWDIHHPCRGTEHSCTHHSFARWNQAPVPQTSAGLGGTSREGLEAREARPGDSPSRQTDKERW